MIINHKNKIAFSRTPGCGDAAMEIILRDRIVEDGDIATSMPYFEKDGIGNNEFRLGPMATPNEIKKYYPDYKVFVIKRNVIDSIYSEYLWLSSISKVNCTFKEFVTLRKYKRKPNSQDGADEYLNFSTVLKDLRSFLKAEKTSKTIPTRLSFNEFEGTDIKEPSKDEVSAQYSQELLTLLRRAGFVFDVAEDETPSNEIENEEDFEEAAEVTEAIEENEPEDETPEEDQNSTDSEDLTQTQEDISETDSDDDSDIESYTGSSKYY